MMHYNPVEVLDHNYYYKLQQYSSPLRRVLYPCFPNLLVGFRENIYPLQPPSLPVFHTVCNQSQHPPGYVSFCIFQQFTIPNNVRHDNPLRVHGIQQSTYSIKSKIPLYIWHSVSDMNLQVSIISITTTHGESFKLWLWSRDGLFIVQDEHSCVSTRAVGSMDVRTGYPLQPHPLLEL